jgi:hypothetical protein
MKIIRPGDYMAPLPQVCIGGPITAEDEEEDGQDAAAELPPFEPLVLWAHDEDISKRIEVS